MLLGNGDGTFQPAVVHGSGGGVAISVAVADMNGDGKPDLVTGNCSPNGCGAFQPLKVVGVLLGNGDGTFQSAKASGSGSYISVAVADVDSDKKPDVVAASMSCGGGGAGCVQVFFGDGSGSFQADASYDIGINPLSIATSDLNGDGAPDVVVTHEWGNGLGLPPGEVDVVLNRNIPPPPLTITLSASLGTPKENKVPVTLSGTITDTVAEVKSGSAAFTITDGDGRVKLQGGIYLRDGGRYSFTIWLQSLGPAAAPGGRHYTITVHASDNAGNVGSQSIAVTIF